MKDETDGMNLHGSSDEWSYALSVNESHMQSLSQNPDRWAIVLFEVVCYKKQKQRKIEPNYKNHSN